MKVHDFDEISLSNHLVNRPHGPQISDQNELKLKKGGLVPWRSIWRTYKRTNELTDKRTEIKWGGWRAILRTDEQTNELTDKRG